VSSIPSPSSHHPSMQAAVAQKEVRLVGPQTAAVIKSLGIDSDIHEHLYQISKTFPPGQWGIQIGACLSASTSVIQEAADLIAEAMCHDAAANYDSA
jgi:hypothetical protein